jgi:hypothetical protein
MVKYGGISGPVVYSERSEIYRKALERQRKEKGSDIGPGRRRLKYKLLAPSSSGPGRLAFIQEIAGSIPAGVTQSIKLGKHVC